MSVDLHIKLFSYFFQFLYYAAHSFVEGVLFEVVALGDFDIRIAVEAFLQQFPVVGREMSHQFVYQFGVVSRKLTAVDFGVGVCQLVGLGEGSIATNASLPYVAYKHRPHDLLQPSVYLAGRTVGMDAAEVFPHGDKHFLHQVLGVLAAVAVFDAVVFYLPEMSSMQRQVPFVEVGLCLPFCVLHFFNYVRAILWPKSDMGACFFLIVVS